MAIFGDYDVDGAASAALLSEYLQARGCETPRSRPLDRDVEGLWPYVEAMAAFKAKGAFFVVTAPTAARSASSRSPRPHGSDQTSSSSIITRLRRKLCLARRCFIVDPNRQDDLSGLLPLLRKGQFEMGLVALNRALRESGFFDRGKTA